MGQCMPSRTPPASSFTDAPLPQNSTLSRYNRRSAHYTRHSVAPPPAPALGFRTIYRHSKIVNKQLFLNSGFMEDDYCYSTNYHLYTNLTAVAQQPSYTTTCYNRSNYNSSHLISATFAYSVSLMPTPYADNTNPLFRCHSTTTIPKLVFDISASSSMPQRSSSCTFITVWSDNDSPLPTTSSTPQRTTAEEHTLPIVTRVSLESLESDSRGSSSSLGRTDGEEVEMIAYF